jgi:hypothetical protein
VPAWRDFLRLLCPLLTPAYTISAPCGLLTRWSVCLRILSFVFLSFPRFGSSVVRTRCPTDAGDLINRFSLFPVSQATVPMRCSGPPGVSSGYFQRTIVRYTRFDPMTDRGLCPVLRTRPGLTSPRICLPSTFWVRGIPVRRPTLLPPASFSRYITATDLAFSYPSPPSGWIWTLTDTSVIIPVSTI